MIVSFCKDNGSGMSECTECGTGYENQSHCDFAKKSSDSNRCRFQIFDEYCNLESAQRYAKGGRVYPHELQNNEWLQEHEKLHRQYRKEVTRPVFPNFRDAMPYAEISDDGLSMTFATLQDNSGTLSKEQLLELQKTVEEIKNCEDDMEEITFIDVAGDITIGESNPIEYGSWPIHSHSHPPKTEKFQKKEMCNTCALGYKYCNNRCMKYLQV